MICINCANTYCLAYLTKCLAVLQYMPVPGCHFLHSTQKTSCDHLGINFITAYYKSERQNPHMIEQTCSYALMFRNNHFHISSIFSTNHNSQQKIKGFMTSGSQSSDGILHWSVKTIRWLQYNKQTIIMQYNNKWHVQIYCRFLFDIGTLSDFTRLDVE